MPSHHRSKASVGFVLAICAASAGCVAESADDEPSGASSSAGTAVQLCPSGNPLAVAAYAAQVALWQGCFQNPVAKRLVGNYLTCSGSPLKLSRQEMANLHPVFNLESSTAFISAMKTARSRIGSDARSAKIDVNGQVAAYGTAGGTLGNFFADYGGTLQVCRDGRYLFVGTATFADHWDFDAKQPGIRSERGEQFTRYGAQWLSGAAYDVSSDAATFYQTNGSQFVMTGSRAVMEISPATPLQGLSGMCGAVLGEVRQVLHASDPPARPRLDC